MTETDHEFFHLKTTLDLLESTGFPDSRKPEFSSPEKLAAGIAWCIAIINGVHLQSDASSENLVRGNKIDWKRIGEDLRSIGCTIPLQAFDDEKLDGEDVFSVIQWLATRIRALPVDRKSQGTCALLSAKVNESLRPLQADFNNAGVSIKLFNEESDEMSQRKVLVLNELQYLRERINEGANHMVKKLMSCSKTLEELEKQESEFLSTCNAKRSELKGEIVELELKLERGCDCSSFIDSLDHSISESEENLNSKKKALASKLRATLAAKRLLDDVPTQSELIQYERRFSELYVNIQGKLRQTRAHYATYNALQEIKDLMLKETSLLNSISSQFQNAITSPTSQTKLIDSMEGILKGIRQKLEKVQLSQQVEQQVCNTLKERYAAATAEQRLCYTLLKAFQEECSKNERLRIQNSM